ncbi:hypothetical protein KI688_009239 [Linnemannia hyalina]|uniref:Uncharacterized protein n=1 Tax=Linnemannia hyalina TaxID=64524 RepID=A0A9P7Y1T6_9FUNG|nr:hypothetical protein KI688_009239 [Linnemannia hyalina]
MAPMMLKTITSLALVAALAISQVAAQDTQQAGTQSTGSGPTVEAYDADIGDNTKWYPGGWGYWGYPRYYGWGYGRRIWW